MHIKHLKKYSVTRRVIVLSSSPPSLSPSYTLCVMCVCVCVCVCVFLTAAFGVCISSQTAEPSRQL